MATTVYSSANDGYVYKYVTTNWADCRDATDGTGSSRTVSSLTQGVRVHKTAHPRYYIYRSFFQFDTSGITDTPTSLTLNIRGATNTTGDVIAIKADHDIFLSTNDFDNVDFSTPYSMEKSTWAIAVNTITLNEDARNDARDLDLLRVAVVNYDYDYLDVEPGDTTNYANGMSYSEMLGTSKDPYIEYELPLLPLTLHEIKALHIARMKVSGSLSVPGTAQKITKDKQGRRYTIGGPDIWKGSNLGATTHQSESFSDINGKQLKQNNVVKFTPSFLKFVPGNWQIFPSASSGRNTGDGEITLVNDTNGWNFTFDSAEHKNFVSASFIEFVDDGPE